MYARKLSIDTNTAGSSVNELPSFPMGSRWRPFKPCWRPQIDNAAAVRPVRFRHALDASLLRKP